MIDLRLGDCLELLKDIPDKSIDLVVTDPPYLIDTEGSGFYAKNNDIQVKYGASVGNNRQVMNNLKNIKNGFDALILDELCRVMKKINIYIWCSQKQIISLLKYFVDKKCNWNLIVWHKTNPVPACGNKYLTDTEYCLFFREKGVKVYGNVSTKKTYYVTPKNDTDRKKYNHPTIKPVDIIKNLIINSSQENDTILDCFMGSGTTGVACKNLNRNFIGIEIDEQYYEIAKQRINETEQETTIFDFI